MPTPCFSPGHTAMAMPQEFLKSKDKVKLVSGADLLVSEPKTIPYHSKGNSLAETAAPALDRTVVEEELALIGAGVTEKESCRLVVKTHMQRRLEGYRRSTSVVV